MTAFMCIDGSRRNVDFEPLDTDEERNHISNAVSGSRKLRDAILRSKGHPVPYEPAKARVLPFRRPVVAKPKPVEPEPSPCCETCGAPVAPSPATLVSDIQAAVTAYYRLAPNAMRSAQRRREFAHPRQIAMFLSSELTHKSLPEIGRRFERDHTTVLYAIRAVTQRLSTDAGTQHDVRVIRRMLGK